MKTLELSYHHPAVPGVVAMRSRTDDPVHALVRRAREGDVSAFESLYRKHVGRVFAVCLRMTGDRGRAEELTQDVFVRAWEKLHTFEGRSAFSSWLHRLAVNLVLSAQRTRRRFQARFVPADGSEAEEGPAPAAAPGAALDLERAVASLPTQARTVFVLYDIEGFTHRQIAELTGLAEGTSKAHLHRARKLLRGALSR